MEVDIFEGGAKRTASGAEITNPDNHEPQCPRLDREGSQPKVDGY